MTNATVQKCLKLLTGCLKSKLSVCYKKKHSHMTILSMRNELARCVYRLDRPTNMGRPRILSVVSAIDAIMFVCKTGCQWSALTSVFRRCEHLHKIGTRVLKGFRGLGG